MDIKIFNKTLDLLGNALDAQMVRNNIISSNIANQETPGYESKDLDFKKIFKTAKEEMQQGGPTYGPAGRLVSTDSRHLTHDLALGQIQEGLIISEPLEPGSNKSSVRVEQEMTKLAENSFMYNATAQILSKKLKGLKEAIFESAKRG